MAHSGKFCSGGEFITSAQQAMASVTLHDGQHSYSSCSLDVVWLAEEDMPMAQAAGTTGLLLMFSIITHATWCRYRPVRLPSGKVDKKSNLVNPAGCHHRHPTKLLTQPRSKTSAYCWCCPKVQITFRAWLAFCAACLLGLPNDSAMTAAARS